MQNHEYLSLQQAQASGHDGLMGVVGYMTNFLAQPHPWLQEVGHTGNVCPYTEYVLGTEPFPSAFLPATRTINKLPKSSAQI